MDRPLVLWFACMAVLGTGGCGIKAAPRPPLPPPSAASPPGEGLSPDGQRGPLPSSIPPPDATPGTPAGTPPDPKSP